MTNKSTLVSLSLSLLLVIARSPLASGTPLPHFARQDLADARLARRGDVGAEAGAALMQRLMKKEEEEQHAHDSTSVGGEAAKNPMRVATVLQTPTAAILYDPEASWTAPMIPSGHFNPMPHVAEQQEAPASSTPLPKEHVEHAVPSLAPSTDEAIHAITEAANKAQESIHAASLTTSSSGAESGTPQQGHAVKRALAISSSSLQKLRRATRLEQGKTTGMLVRKRGLAATLSLVKRQDAATAAPSLGHAQNTTACPVDDRETLVPVTYNELELIKLGLLKLQPLAEEAPKSPSNATATAPPTAPACLSNLMQTVIMVPVSDMQMMAIQQGELVIKSTEQDGVAVLITAAEQGMQAKTGESDASPEKTGETDEPGPLFDVVPVKLEEAQANNGIPPSMNAVVAEQGAPAANATAAANTNATSNAPAPPAKRNTYDRRRSAAEIQTRLVRRQESVADLIDYKLERRVSSSSAGNTSLVGNGAGKLKYGHKIHFNAGHRIHSKSSTRVRLVALFLLVAAILSFTL